MRTCPVCGAKAFDDAAMCYGCLYRFEGEDGSPGNPMPSSKADRSQPGPEAYLAQGSEVSFESDAFEPACGGGDVDGGGFRPSFLITFTPPALNGQGAWTCSVAPAVA